MAKIGGSMWNPMVRGYIDARWPFAPLTVKGMEVHDILDHITAAVESGDLDRETWPEQIFATDGDVQQFLERLDGEYEECFRIVDRWWFALSDLIGYNDEEGFITAREIANEIETEWLSLKRDRVTAAEKAAAKKPAKKRKAVAA